MMGVGTLRKPTQWNPWMGMTLIGQHVLGLFFVLLGSIHSGDHTQVDRLKVARAPTCEATDTTMG